MSPRREEKSTLRVGGCRVVDVARARSRRAVSPARPPTACTLDNRFVRSRPRENDADAGASLGRASSPAPPRARAVGHECALPRPRRRAAALNRDRHGQVRRIKLLGKGSFGSAVLVTLAKDPSKKFVVVRSRRARPRVASALGQRPGKRQRRRKRRGPRSIARRTLTNPNPQSRSPSDPPSPSTSQKEVDISKMPKEERDASLQEAKLLSALHHPNIVTRLESFTEAASVHRRTTAPAATCTSESRRREVLLPGDHDRGLVHREKASQAEARPRSQGAPPRPPHAKCLSHRRRKVQARRFRRRAKCSPEPTSSPPLPSARPTTSPQRFAKTSPYDHKSDGASGASCTSCVRRGIPLTAPASNFSSSRSSADAPPPRPKAAPARLCDTIREMLSRDPARRRVGERSSRAATVRERRETLAGRGRSARPLHRVALGEKAAEMLDRRARAPIKLRGRPVRRRRAARSDKSARATSARRSRADARPSAAALWRRTTLVPRARAAPVGGGVSARPAARPCAARLVGEHVRGRRRVRGPGVPAPGDALRRAPPDAAEKRRLAAAAADAADARGASEARRAPTASSRARRAARGGARRRARRAARRRTVSTQGGARQADARACVHDVTCMRFSPVDGVSRARRRRLARARCGSRARPPAMGVPRSRSPRPTFRGFGASSARSRSFGGGRRGGAARGSSPRCCPARDEATKRLSKSRTPPTLDDVDAPARPPRCARATCSARWRSSGSPPAAVGRLGSPSCTSCGRAARTSALGGAAAERNRRRADMEDEFSGGAGVDVGVSEEGARLLIDPGTEAHGRAWRRTRALS